MNFSLPSTSLRMVSLSNHSHSPSFAPLILVSGYVYSLIVMGMVNHGDYDNGYNLVHPVRELSLGTSIYRNRIHWTSLGKIY